MVKRKKKADRGYWLYEKIKHLHLSLAAARRINKAAAANELRVEAIANEEGVTVVFLDGPDNVLGFVEVSNQTSAAL